MIPSMTSTLCGFLENRRFLDQSKGVRSLKLTLKTLKICTLYKKLVKAPKLLNKVEFTIHCITVCKRFHVACKRFQYQYIGINISVNIYLMLITL